MNAIKFRRACALVKRESKIAKQNTWNSFLNSINPLLDVRTIWARVKNIRTEKRNNFPSIIDGSTIMSNPIEIANKFAQV